MDDATRYTLAREQAQRANADANVAYSAANVALIHARGMSGAAPSPQHDLDLAAAEAALATAAEEVRRTASDLYRVKGHISNPDHPLSMTFYCVKCKRQNSVALPFVSEIVMKNGKPAYTAECPFCDGRVFRIGHGF